MYDILETNLHVLLYLFWPSLKNYPRSTPILQCKLISKQENMFVVEENNFQLRVLIYNKLRYPLFFTTSMSIKAEETCS
jgi:hypothetical protein